MFSADQLGDPVARDVLRPPRERPGVSLRDLRNHARRERGSRLAMLCMTVVHNLPRSGTARCHDGLCRWEVRADRLQRPYITTIDAFEPSPVVFRPAIRAPNRAGAGLARKIRVYAGRLLPGGHL